MHGLLEGRGDTGITLRAFRFSAAANHLMLAGRRGRVYDRIVVLSGVQPGDSVLDVGSSSGYLTGRLAAAAGPSGQVTGVDPAEPAIAYARRHARPGNPLRDLATAAGYQVDSVRQAAAARLHRGRPPAGIPGPGASPRPGHWPAARLE